MHKLSNEMMFFFVSGIRDENNNTYNPKTVRIGVKALHSVKAVSMDYLVSDIKLQYIFFITSVNYNDFNLADSTKTFWCRSHIRWWEKRCW